MAFYDDCGAVVGVEFGTVPRVSTFRHRLFGGGNGTGVHTSNAYIYTERTVASWPTVGYRKMAVVREIAFLPNFVAGLPSNDDWSGRSTRSIMISATLNGSEHNCTCPSSRLMGVKIYTNAHELEVFYCNLFGRADTGDNRYGVPWCHGWSLCFSFILALNNPVS